MSHFHLLLMFCTDYFYFECLEVAVLVRCQLKEHSLCLIIIIVIVSPSIFSTALFCRCAQTPINHSQLFWCEFPLRHVQNGRGKLVFAHLWSIWETVEWTEWKPCEKRQRSGVAKQDEMLLRCRLTSSPTNGCCFCPAYLPIQFPNWAHQEEQIAETIW